MRRPVPWIAIVALFCCLKTSAKEADIDIVRVLLQFPGFRLVTLQERDPDTRASIAKHFPKNDASVGLVDLDGDGQSDLALLFKDDKSAWSTLVIFLCPSPAECKPAYQLGLGSVEFTYMTSVPVGSKATETEAEEDGTAPVRLKFPGIRHLTANQTT